MNLQDMSNEQLDHETYLALRAVSIAEADLDIEGLAKADDYQRKVGDEVLRREKIRAGQA